MKAGVVPLCVDLDGTLVRGDCMFAALFWVLRHRGWRLPGLLVTFFRRGRAAFKRELAAVAVGFDAAEMPVVREVSAWCGQRVAEGRELWLVSGSDEVWARQAAGRFGFFRRVIGSDGVRNVSGEGKRRVLVELCGERGFDYVGNAAVDLRVWRGARRAVVANGGSGLVRRAGEVCEVAEVIGRPERRWRAFWRGLRPGQWVKNLLVVAPVVTSHQWGDVGLVLGALGAAVVFCVVASGVYLVNDAWDCEGDRGDVVKRRRPVAAGELGQWWAFFSGLGLMAAGVLGALLWGWHFAGWVLGYAVMAVVYSVLLKNVMGVDLVVLVGFYLARIYAGGAATGIEISGWLSGFAGAVFLFLGCLKRAMSASGAWVGVPPAVLVGLGSLAGAAAVGVLAGYPGSAQARELYGLREPLWLLGVVVGVWCVWIWRRCGTAAERCEAAEPVAVVLRDPWSWVALVLCGGVLLWAR